jgi:cytochrome c-type biogenesis protein CcmH
MTLFLIGAAVLLAGTLLLLLPPLMRGAVSSAAAPRDALNLALLREQLRELDADLAADAIDAANHAQAREELRQRVAQEVLPLAPQPAPRIESRWTAIVIGVALPVLAAALYVVIGTPLALTQQAVHEVDDRQVQAMVEGLAARMRAQPDSADGWQMLARSYNVLGRFRDAADAYARLVALVPDNAGYYADYADTLAMAQGQSLQGEPEKLIAKALAIDGGNLKALALSGSAAFERGQFEQAAQIWEKLVAVAPPGSDIADATANSIAQAKRLAAERAASGGQRR